MSDEKIEKIEKIEKLKKHLAEKSKEVKEWTNSCNGWKGFADQYREERNKARAAVEFAVGIFTIMAITDKRYELVLKTIKKLSDWED